MSPISRGCVKTRQRTSNYTDFLSALVFFVQEKTISESCRTGAILGCMNVEPQNIIMMKNKYSAYSVEHTVMDFLLVVFQ